MAKRESIKTTKEEIVQYWSKHQDESGLSVDWAEANERCWRCGYIRTLERCHIIPYSLGGKDIPQNLVLLCKRCHQEGPNVEDPEIMWDWIRAYGVPFYDTFWNCKGMKEYQLVYGHSFENAIMYIMRHAKSSRDNNEIMNAIKEKATRIGEVSGVHFGQSYWNTATIAGNCRMIVKSLAEQEDVDIKKLDRELQEDTLAWWL